MKNYLTLFSLTMLLFASCNNTSEEEQDTGQIISSTDSKPQLTSGITPPVEGLNVPFMQKKLNAEAGGAFVYETGSIVTFPENAVLHKDGSPVKGEIDVAYREFQDPVDMYFSGIPMHYDSMETTYNFVSAGMCELKAYQNGEELIVNPASKPAVDMVSKDADPVHNLYYYDESAQKWLPKGKPTIDELKEATDQPELAEALPVKPQKADPEKYSFYISIEDLGGEFQGFDNMHFQIADEEKNYNPADASIKWYTVNVKKSPKLKGKYLVSFSNATQSRTYITDPVFSEEEYDKAMATYNQIMKEKAEEIKKMEEEVAAWEKEQALILKQNRIIDSINQQAKAEMEAYQNVVKGVELSESGESTDIRDVAFRQGEYSITRGMEVDGFGVWNCDNPVFLDGYVDTEVKFEGISNEVDGVAINRVFSVIYKKKNSVFGNNIDTYRNLPNVPEIIFFVDNKVLYYGANNDNKELAEIKLHQLDVSSISYKDIKKKLIGS
ncbi:hypothetical protein [Parvicella tangerina]|uniref:Uncharacterized protein n=1 Tax=Parvicella tangerina TaxID=2829795 RepID=A0A916JMZ0_9FLAO|nr:hypothetical protein [Parvicella tangerina]CAG5081932.1 hypothetical protein CRYO30217_01765 [Parvicella tangerina]